MKKRSLWRRLKNWQPIYWLRTHTIDRHHIVDCRTPGYRWGWIDRDNLMFNACFNILQRFVEKEAPGIGLDETLEDYAYEGMDEDAEAVILQQIKRHEEIRALYNWWKTERWEEHRACSRLLDGVDCSFDAMFKPLPDGGYELNPERDPREVAFCEETKRLEAKDEEMLERLMRVRQSLWT